MRIGLQTWGSEGDIRPFFALAEGLQKARHKVTLVVTSAENKDYTSLARSLKINMWQGRGTRLGSENLGGFAQSGGPGAPASAPADPHSRKACQGSA
jgi:hypothetical protein